MPTEQELISENASASNSREPSKANARERPYAWWHSSRPQFAKLARLGRGRAGRSDSGPSGLCWSPGHDCHAHALG